ncbi:uracil-DNA glycosylase [Candidatus Pacearchaeota archaeon]|nr:uracil-DNA glycosylase [Candidatus Pacearchaeota archaeon]
MSRYTDHVAKWRNCRRCNLCKSRHNVVLLRGHVPCQVLFVGEAPGTSENLLGKPFSGPAGNLLNRMLAEALPPSVTYAITNLVGCIPKDTEEGAGKNKLGEPPTYAIEACKPRLVEIVQICQPKIIISVGKLAKKWLPILLADTYRLGEDYKTADIIHPAAILRADVSQQGLAIQRSLVTIQDAVEDL